MLAEAVLSNDGNRVRDILNAKPALINAAGKDGRTALHIAVVGRKEGMVRLLLQFGANARTGIGRHWEATTPLATARDRGYGEIESLLRLEDADLDEESVGNGDEEKLGDLELLLAQAQAGDLTQPGDDRGWPLRLAVDSNRPDILRELLDLGLDPDARVRVEDEGEVYTWGMPLYACVRAGRHAMAEMLLERGADANGQVYASGTPLSEAYGQRDEAMIALLIRFGGKPNPSMAGLYRRKDLAMQLLAEHGDASLPDDGFGSGPVAEQLLAAAAKRGDAERLRLAMDRVSIPDGDQRWNGLLAAPQGFWNHWYGPWCHQEWDRSTYSECFRVLLERSGPPNHQFQNGVTILHEIATMGDHVREEERVAFARAALEAGARMDLRDDLLKSTPLGWAARWGRLELMRLYLDRGVDVSEADAEPWARPLAWAEKKQFNEVAAMLRERGASAQQSRPDRPPTA